MFPIRFKRPALLCMAMLTVVLSGCGLIQKVVDESKSVASAVFYKQIKILQIYFKNRIADLVHIFCGGIPIICLFNRYSSRAYAHIFSAIIILRYLEFIVDFISGLLVL